jgi:hypothetical protein
MKKTCYQCENYDWTKQKIKNRTTIIRNSRKEKTTFLDHIRSFLF